MHLPFAAETTRAGWYCQRAALALAFFVAACKKDGPPAENNPVPPPGVAGLGIIPGDVFAIPGSQFEMRVHLVDASGNVLPETYGTAVEWTPVSTPGMTITGSPGPRVMVSVSQLSTTPFELTAMLPGPGISASVKIHSIKLGQTTSEDWVAATATPKSPPMLALADARWGSNYKTAQVYSFVGGGSLESIAKCAATDPAGCGNLTIFSTTNAPDHGAAIWTSGCDIADKRSTIVPLPSCQPVFTGALKPATPIDLQVWMFAPSASHEAVKAYVEYTKRVLSDAWAGLAVSATIHVGGQKATPLLEVDPVTYACLPGVKTGLDELGINSLGAKVITLVIAEDILVKDEHGDPVPSGLPGYACPTTTSWGAVAFVAWPLSTYTTLAHEIGHALGPWDAASNWGHTDGIAGFNQSNLMHASHSYSVEAPRSTLTLGQVFRLGLDRAALVQQTSTLPHPQCNLTTASACPALNKDVRP
jgi:hypothetical protein